MIYPTAVWRIDKVPEDEIKYAINQFLWVNANPNWTLEQAEDIAGKTFDLMLHPPNSVKDLFVSKKTTEIGINDILMHCISCGWQGTIDKCTPTIDRIGSFGCPECGNIVQLERI